MMNLSSKTIFALFLFAFGIPFLTYAEEKVEATTGFVGRSIWYSYESSDTKPTITIHAAVINGEDQSLKGIVRFYDGKTKLGEQSVDMLVGEVSEVSQTIPDTKTIHSFYARLEESKLKDGTALDSLFATRRLYVKTNGAIGFPDAPSLPPESLAGSIIKPFLTKPLLVAEWTRFGLADALTTKVQSFWEKEELTKGQSVLRDVLGVGLLIVSSQGLFYVVVALIIWGIFVSIRRMFFGV